MRDPGLAAPAGRGAGEAGHGSYTARAGGGDTVQGARPDAGRGRGRGGDEFGEAGGKRRRQGGASGTKPNMPSNMVRQNGGTGRPEDDVVRVCVDGCYEPVDVM